MKPALEGIRVLELAQWIAAPSAGVLLADWGAEVIHVEHPGRGDGYRGIMALQQGGSVVHADFNYAFEMINRNKKGITIDLNKDEGREVIHKLVRSSDVFLSNLRPHELDRYGFRYDTLSNLNARLVYAIVTGYGREGPDKDVPGYDFSAFWARSGIASMLAEPGKPPPWPRPGFGDHLTGISLACGIAMALLVRERTGLGQEVDVSLFSTGMWALSSDIQGSLITRQDRARLSREELPNPLVNYYRCKDDKWIILTMPQSDPYWPSFCKAIEDQELEHDSRFGSLRSRAENRLALIHILDEVFVRRTGEEWKARLTEFGLIFAPVQSLTDVIADPQATSNEYFSKFNHPAHGPIELIANPIKLSKTPASIRTPSPELGQHTEEILLELGYGWEDIDRLKGQGVIL